jgi:hypothetical protein
MNRRFIRWLIALVVLVVIVAVADRVGATVASNTAGRYLAKQAAFESPPKVEIDGIPFLTQAVEGRYRDVRIRAAEVTLAGVQASNLQANLHGVHLPLHSVLGGHVQTLPIDSVAGSVTFSYAEIEKLAQSQIPGLTLVDQGGQLRVSAKLTVPVVGGSADVTGTGTVTVSGNELTIKVTGVSVAGVSVPSEVISQLEAILAAPIAIPALPYGLHLDSVTAGPAGLMATGSARNVVLASPSG